MASSFVPEMHWSIITDTTEYVQDWKHSANVLPPDAHLRVDMTIATEMLQKHHKIAGYVFLNPGWIEEVSIDAGQPPKRTRFPDDHDRLMSGNGKRYADLSPLVDLQQKTVAEQLHCLYRYSLPLMHD